MIRLIIKGRISNARYLEAPPYHARKERGDRGYFQYVVDMTDHAAAEKLAANLDGTYHAERERDDWLTENTGLWVEIINLEAEAAATAAMQQALQVREQALLALGIPTQRLRALIERMEFVAGDVEEAERERLLTFSSPERKAAIEKIFADYYADIDKINWNDS